MSGGNHISIGRGENGFRFRRKEMTSQREFEVEKSSTCVKKIITLMLIDCKELLFSSLGKALLNCFVLLGSFSVFSLVSYFYIFHSLAVKSS